MDQRVQSLMFTMMMKYKIQIGTRGEYMPLFLAGARLFKSEDTVCGNTRYV